MIGIKRRTWILLVVILLVAVACGQSSNQAEYPSRAITVVIPVSPGGTIDTSTRLVTQNWDLGVPFIDANQPGAATEVGALTVLGSDNEGYTMFSTTMDLHVAMAYLLSDKVSVDDFAPLGGTMSLEPALLVNKDTPWQTAQEFISALQQKGSGITIAVVQGNALQIQALLLLEALGSDATVVPFSSGGDARAAVLGGHTDATIIPAAGYPPLADDTRILAIFADHNPAPELTDNAPTWSEVSDIQLPLVRQVLTWYVTSEFADKYPDRYQKLVDGFASVVQSDAFASSLAAAQPGFDKFIDYTTPDQILSEQDAMIKFLDKYGSVLQS